MTLYVSASCPRARHRRHRRRATKGGACGSGRQTRLQASPPRGRHTRTLGRTPDPVPLRVRASRSARCCALARRRRCAQRTSIPPPPPPLRSCIPSGLTFIPRKRKQHASDGISAYLQGRWARRGVGPLYTVPFLRRASRTDLSGFCSIYTRSALHCPFPPGLSSSRCTHHPLTFD